MLELNKIYNMDCIEGLKQIEDEKIDIIITSPPYNFDMNYDTYNDKISWDNYKTWLFSVWQECFRVLKDGGRLIVNVQPLFSDYIPTHHIISNQCTDIGFIWRNEILWEKNNYNCKYCSWGSWKSPSSPYLKYTWEFIEVFSKGSIKHKGKKEDIDITGDEFKEWVLAKWNIAPERKMKEYRHPAMFPEKLVERLLKLFSFKNDIILDPFMGSGTTAVACIKTNRKYIGFELSEEYCKMAEKRIEPYLMQQTIFDLQNISANNT